jgi:phosphoribosylaminoimidazole (AIR) synthetase
MDKKQKVLMDTATLQKTLNSRSKGQAGTDQGVGLPGFATLISVNSYLTQTQMAHLVPESDGLGEKLEARLKEKFTGNIVK